MKSRILAMLLFILPLSVNAQVFSGYGIKIGLVSSKAEDLSTASYLSNLYHDSRVSGSYGLFAHFLDSKYFRFEAELEYKQEGAEDKIPITTAENPDGTGQFVIVDHGFDFLSFNISFQPKIETEDFCLFGIISPTLNFMLKNRDQIIWTDDINDFLFGYKAGIGFQPKNFLNGRLFAEIKYGGSFSEFIKADYLKAKFNTIQFSLGAFIN